MSLQDLGSLGELITALATPGDLSWTETWQMNEWLLSATAARQNTATAT